MGKTKKVPIKLTLVPKASCLASVSSQGGAKGLLRAYEKDAKAAQAIMRKSVDEWVQLQKGVTASASSSQGLGILTMLATTTSKSKPLERPATLLPKGSVGREAQLPKGSVGLMWKYRGVGQS